MTSYIWIGGSGDWSDAADWTPSGGPPKSTDMVTISATGGACVVTVDSADTAGSLTLSSADATLEADGANGMLTIAGDLDMSAGVLDIATGTIGSGTVSIGGNFDLSGGALNVYAGGVLKLAGVLRQSGGAINFYGGTISGGTIRAQGSADTWDGVTFDDVIFQGWLGLRIGETAHLANGAKIVGFGGAAGLISTGGAELYFDDSQTIANVTIDIGGYFGGGSLILDDTRDVGKQILPFAHDVTINSSTYGERIDVVDNSGDSIVNQGIINVLGGQMETDEEEIDTTFDNSGVINALGGEMDIWDQTFDNSGSLNVGENMMTYIGADLTRSSIDNSGTITVGVDGTLDLLAGKFINSGKLILDAGSELHPAAVIDINQETIELRGGSINSYYDPYSVTNASGSSLVGYGSVVTPFVNSGIFEASGGTLEFLDSVSGAGSDVISGAATLEFATNISGGQAVSFTGSRGALALFSPNTFSGSISDFDMGGASADSLILGKPWTYVGFAENSGLTEGMMTLANGTSTTTLTLLGDYAAADFAHHTNGSGHTVVTYA